METKVSQLLMNYLYDLQMEESPVKKYLLTNFCKYLVMNYKDTTVEIDPEKEYEKFLETPQIRAGLKSLELVIASINQTSKTLG